MTFVNTEFPAESSREGTKLFLEGITDKNLDTDTGGSSLSVSTTFNRKWQLLRMLITFDAASVATITLTYDSRNGEKYDTVLYTQTLSGETDVLVEGGIDIDTFQKGDELKLDISSGSGYPHVYVTVLGKELA